MKTWRNDKLDATKPSPVMFMDKNDTLNLYFLTNTPLPESASSPTPEPADDIPF